MEEKKLRKPQIGVEVTPEEKALIEKVAKERGMRAATLLRTLALEEARRLRIK
ncbi:plasmid mobilization protein [Hymenobacter bucti]|uniref:Ribbon-helix-helix protein, CopG family n=1 Tax=Hymenobacter bucti TaxID=1844114 RepID=A0ABW4QY17_9BACT